MKLAVNIMIAATNQACAEGFADADFCCVASLVRSGPVGGHASASRLLSSN